MFFLAFFSKIVRAHLIDILSQPLIISGYTPNVAVFQQLIFEYFIMIVDCLVHGKNKHTFLFEANILILNKIQLPYNQQGGYNQYNGYGKLNGYQHISQ